MSTAAHKFINQDSGDTEYYTPKVILDAARETMGSIDLDPASSECANRNVKATYFFTKELNGLTQPWFGRVWLNHPFSRQGNPLWIRKLIKSYDNFDLTEFCCITFAATSETWFQPLLELPQCFLSPRTNYVTADGTLKRGVTKGSVVTYGGPCFQTFKRCFEKYGVVK